MDNQQPTLEELEVYQKVARYLESKRDKNDNRFSILPKSKWLIAVIVALAAFSFYYALTNIIFGQEFWVRSIAGPPLK